MIAPGIWGLAREDYVCAKAMIRWYFDVCCDEAPRYVVLKIRGGSARVLRVVCCADIKSNEVDAG